MRADLFVLGRCVRGTALCLLLSACSFPDYEFTPDGGVHAEDCTNALDDDGDGKVDCADSDCTSAGYQCVTEIPAGWLGPVAFWSGGVDDTAPACSSSGGYDQVVQDKVVSGLAADPATCPTCDCQGTETLTGEVRTAQVRWMSSSVPNECVFSSTSGLCPLTITLPSTTTHDCSSVELTRAALTDTFKAAAGANAPSYSLFLDILTSDISGGNCEAVTSGELVVSPYSFTGIGRICRSDQSVGTCKSAGSVCVKKPSSTFDSGICIYHEGTDQTCPAGWTVSKPVQFAALKDSRACSACECPADWGASPIGSANVTDYRNNSGCLTGKGSEATNNGETGSDDYLATDPETRYYDVEVLPANTPTCTKTGGEPIGEVSSSEITLCCAGE